MAISRMTKYLRGAIGVIIECSGRKVRASLPSHPRRIDDERLKSRSLMRMQAGTKKVETIRVGHSPSDEFNLSASTGSGP